MTSNTKRGFCECGSRLTEDEVERGTCYPCSEEGRQGMRAYNLKHHGLLIARLGQEAYWSECAREILARHACGMMIRGRDADRGHRFIESIDEKRAIRGRS